MTVTELQELAEKLEALKDIIYLDLSPDEQIPERLRVFSDPVNGFWVKVSTDQSGQQYEEGLELFADVVDDLLKVAPKLIQEVIRLRGMVDGNFTPSVLTK